MSNLEKEGSVVSDTTDMTDDEFTSAIVRAAAAAFGTQQFGERLLAMLSRSDRVQAAIERETAAMFGEPRRQLPRIDKRNRKVLAQHEREKPTRERASIGEFELLDALKFDTTRHNERILMDWRARAGGAGEMHVRGQLTPRELAAAVKICELAEYASAGLVGGGQFQEGVDGGAADGGQKMLSAAVAAGKYRSTLQRLTKAGRFLVEQRVVLGRPMEEVVRLKGASTRLGEVSVRKRCERAVVVLTEALDALANSFGLGG